MEKLQKKMIKNKNSFESLFKRIDNRDTCVCYCGPGGYPWAQARDSASRAAWT